MTYLKVQLLGSLGGGEVWSCGLSYRFFSVFPTVLSQAMLESLVQRLITAITATTLPGSLRTGISTQGALTGFRVEQHDEDEKILAVAQNSYPTPIAGTTAASKSPQDALVISLRTNTPGATGRGRIYWPGLGASLSAAFKVTTPPPATMAADAKTLFKLIGDQINAELAANSYASTVELAVRSVTQHTARTVTRVQVGDTMDTQRRRRDSLVEAYAVVAYP